MTASSCPSCGAPVTPEVVDGIVRDEHRCEYEETGVAMSWARVPVERPRRTRGLAPEASR